MHFRLISLIIWAAGKLCGDLVETAWPRCLVTKSAAQLELSCTVAANPPLEITPHTYKECNVCLKTCRVSVSEDVCDVRVSVSWSMLEQCYMQTVGIAQVEHFLTDVVNVDYFTDQVYATYFFPEK